MKKIALGCLGAVAVLAFAGVGTAAAEQSTFCKSNETPCSASNHYSEGTEFVLKLTGQLKFEAWEVGEEEEGTGSKILEFGCQTEEFKGSTATTGSSTKAVEVAFTSHSLPCGGVLCPMTASQNPKMRFDWINGTMDSSVVAKGMEYTLDCTTLYAGFKCAWAGEMTKGITLKGGNPAVLVFKEAPLPKAAGTTYPLCGTEVRVSGEYEVAAPNPLYVSSS